ncbi:MAG: hypothetical protein EZS28_038353 [Streblomastix strix]|uniref:Uncharacterized protein n=1 Tax=Streblomastix strix TaxID=222440 RepID=A0A5J4U888_9EUKA|nr:MAG: hypothetical protein EZS28_038353 [Streblomastix strix]
MNKSNIALNVWYHCSASLHWVRYYGNVDVQSLLINQWRYIELQIEIGGTAGGSQIENTGIISHASSHIKQMIIDRREGTKQCIATPMLLKDAYEKIENSGGHEELDSLLHHKSHTVNYDARKSAFDTIYYLNNISTDPSNNF